MIFRGKRVEKSVLFRTGLTVVACSLISNNLNETIEVVSFAFYSFSFIVLMFVYMIKLNIVAFY